MKNETTAVEVVCPHCKTRWTWSEDNWFAVIKRHGSGCRCPDNWICTLCSKRCVEPTDVTQYLKNGAHVDCADKELHGELRFPKCECGCTRGRHAGPNAEEYCLRSKCSCDEYRPVTTASPATAWAEWELANRGDWRDVSHSESFYAGYEACQEHSTTQIAALEQDYHDLAETQLDYQKLTHEQREQIAALRPALETILADIEPVCLTCGCVENDHAETGECRNCGIADCGGFRLADDIKIAREALAATPVRESESLRSALETIRNMKVYLGNTNEDAFFLRDFYEGKLEKAIHYAENALAATPADPVREAATALVAEILAAIKSNESEDDLHSVGFNSALKLVVVKLQTALETK